VSADVIIMLNTTSLEGYKYVLLLEDNASKYVWSFPLKDRTAPELLTQLKIFLTHDLPALGIQLEHFHSDGGSELISELVRTFLHAKGITTSHTPRDTPEMNSLLERKVRDLKEPVMSMLLHSTLPVSFWWIAWKTACYLQNRMPTVTVYGYMTPFENDFVEYLLLLRGWCAGLRPPTICAKSYTTYFVSTHHNMLRLKNGVLSAASTRAIYIRYKDNY
jgi:hypothetical protein